MAVSNILCVAPIAVGALNARISLCWHGIRHFNGETVGLGVPRLLRDLHLPSYFYGSLNLVVLLTPLSRLFFLVFSCFRTLLILRQNCSSLWPTLTGSLVFEDFATRYRDMTVPTLVDVRFSTAYDLRLI